MSTSKACSLRAAGHAAHALTPSRVHASAASPCISLYASNSRSLLHHAFRSPAGASKCWRESSPALVDGLNRPDASGSGFRVCSGHSLGILGKSRRVQTSAIAGLHKLPIRRGALVSQFWGGDVGRQNALLSPCIEQRRRQGNATIQAAKKGSDRMSRKIVELQEEGSAPRPKAKPRRRTAPDPASKPPVRPESTPVTPSPQTPAAKTQTPQTPAAKPPQTPVTRTPESSQIPQTAASTATRQAPAPKTRTPPPEVAPRAPVAAPPAPIPRVQKAAPVEKGAPKQKVVTKYGYPLVKERMPYSDLLKDGGRHVRAIYHFHDVRGDVGKIPFMESLQDDLLPGVRVDGSRKDLNLLEDYVPEEDTIAEQPIRVLVALAGEEKVVRSTLPPVKYNRGFWKEFSEARLQYKLIETSDPYRRAAERRHVVEDTGADRAFAGEGQAENFRVFSFPIALVLIVIIYQGIGRLQKARLDEEERQRVKQYQEQKEALAQMGETLGYKVSVEEVEAMQKEFLNSSNEQLGLETTGDDVRDRKIREEAAQNLDLVVGRRFTKSGATKYAATNNKRSKYRQRLQPVTLDDVAGIDNLKKEVVDIVAMLKNPQKWLDRGIKIPTGIILYGPPGCGKTLLAKAIAGEAGFAFFSTSASQFVEIFAGVGAARIRDLYYDALINAPSIVFIDEIDAIGRQRGAQDSGGEERDQTLNQLLVSLDGFSGTGQVVTICATNRIDTLDRALTRPGRFDRKLCVELPSFEDRIKILKVHCKNKPLARYINWYDLGGVTRGMSGAMIANVVNVAVLEAIRKQKEEITTMDLVNAARLEADGYQLAAKIPDNRKLGYAIECAAKIVMAMNTMDFNKITSMSMYETNEGEDAIEGGRRDTMRMFMLSEGFGWHFDYVSILLAPRAVDDLYNGGLDNLSASSFLSTDEARTHARVIVQTGLIDPDRPSYDMNVLYPHHIWELQDVQIAVILEAAYKRCKAVLKENVTLINALAFAVMEEKVLLEERIHELADKYGKFEKRRPTIFRIRDARLELCDPVVREIAPKIEEPWHELNPQVWLEYRETHFNLVQASLWEKMRQNRAIEENERAALSRRVKRVAALKEEGASGTAGTMAVMERDEDGGGGRRRLEEREGTRVSDLESKRRFGGDDDGMERVENNAENGTGGNNGKGNGKSGS